MSTAPATTLVITHPSSGASITLRGQDLTIRAPENGIAVLSCTITELYDLLSNEANPDNPLVVGATSVFTRGAQVRHRGYVTKLDRGQEGAQRIAVTCEDRLIQAEAALATIGGAARHAVQSPVIELEDVLLGYVATVWGHPPEDRYPVYPLFKNSGVLLAPATHDATSPWLGKDACASTELLGTIADSTMLFTVAEGRIFRAPCFVQLDNELLYVSHVYQDVDGDWQCSVSNRGVLGTTAAAHTAGALAYQRLLKPMSDTAPLVMRRDPLGTHVKAEEFRIRYDACCLPFIQDPSSYTGLVADFHAYDLDAATAPTVASIATSWLTGALADDSPGFTAGEVDTSALDVIRIPRLYNQDVRYGLEALGQLFDETWSQHSGANARSIYYYDSGQDKAILRSVAQKTAPDYTFPGECAKRVNDSVNLRKLFSAARASYRMVEPGSLISAERMYHPSVGDAVNIATSGNTATNAITAVMYQTGERANAYGWQADATAGNNLHTGLLLDNDPNTGMGLRCAGVMNYSTDTPPYNWLLFAWFLGDAVVDFAEFIVDLRNYTPFYYAIELVGLDAYTPGDPPTLGNVVWLSGKLRGSLYNGPERQLQRPTQFGRAVLNSRGQV